MMAPGDESRTTTVVLPSLDTRLHSPGTGTLNEGRSGKQTLFRQDAKQATRKVNNSESKSKQHVITNGLHVQHYFTCDSPVRFMMYSEAATAFISLHCDNTVCLYSANGEKQVSSTHLSFLGLTSTKISGRLVGWGPGPVFTLLDRELRPLDSGLNGLDIRVCQAAEHTSEMVTAGKGNVCVWSVLLMKCKVKIVEGLQNKIFHQLAVAPPLSGRPHRAYVVYRHVVTVVNLDGKKVLEHKEDLCSQDITAIVYCSQLDSLIIAEISIRIWGPEWELRMTFEGHDGYVRSLFYCPVLSMLFSASVDCTIRCWNVEEGKAIECIHTAQGKPLLCVGGDDKGGTFFSFSHKRISLWTIKSLYTLHCKINKGTALRQILVSPFPAPYPMRVLCISGDHDVILVAAETGAVLTSFKAKQRILCADYCLHKEVLFALTETGVVLQANTLTNPITLMQEWKRRGQECRQHPANMTYNEGQGRPHPGRACSLVLYSFVADPELALEGWQSLQQKRGCSVRYKAELTDGKNKFLIILGHCRGSLSVLKIDDGKVVHWKPAHGAQRVTTLQAYPENCCLLSTGEDMTVVVWGVYPSLQQCLSQMWSVRFDLPLSYLAVMGPRLALTCQEPSSGTYGLMHVDLQSQSQTGYMPTEHSDHITGLCVCPDLEVFVTSSLDGTVCIWSEENELIRTFQLNRVPESLAYGGYGGELFLDMGGDLYKMNCTKFLPDFYHEMLLYTYNPERIPDHPITKSAEQCSEIMEKSTEELPVTAVSLILAEDMWMQTDYGSFSVSGKDLAALLQDYMKYKKPMPPSTTETRKEAFSRYMRIIYRLPPDVKIDLVDFSDIKKRSFYHLKKPFNRPKPKVHVHPKPVAHIPVCVKSKKETKAPPRIFKPRKVRPQPVVIKPETPKPVTPKPVTPKPETPRRPKITPRPQPQREPTPEVPEFLQQFEEADWFKDLYPDKKDIPSSLSPDAFCFVLLDHLNTCDPPTRKMILDALQALHSQELLQNTDKLYQGLIDLVDKFVRPHMSAVERAAVVQILNLVMLLKHPSYDLVKKLLTLLAFKNLGLRAPVLRMLTALGVKEAEQWLWPEVESWDSEPRDPSDIWKSLHDRADCWLESWLSKYKERDRYLYLRSAAKWKPPNYSAVDVLNYFCSVQIEEHKEVPCEAPARPNNTVLLPLTDRSSQPILRLGETYTRSRAARPPCFILPPLRNRPSLTSLPAFITFPLPQVTLRPFHTYTDEDWVIVSHRRYFILEQSFVEYYR